ncbi:WD40 repeat-like protein [Colletotrichum caudatum]|nr:WD40 repeat-like protein [Colletotrichum caudatum]
MEDEWNSCLQTYEGHEGAVSSVAFSGGGTHLATGSFEYSVKTWDVTGRCLQTLQGHTNGVNSVAFSSNSTQLASALRDSTVKVWAVTGQCLQTLALKTPKSDRRLPTVSFSTTGWRTNSMLVTRSSTWKAHVPQAPRNNHCRLFAAETPRPHSYRIIGDGLWITRNSVNLLWLPPEYRPSWTSAVSGSSVAIGCQRGRVLSFRFLGGRAGCLVLGNIFVLSLCYKLTMEYTTAC